MKKELDPEGTSQPVLPRSAMTRIHLPLAGVLYSLVLLTSSGLPLLHHLPAIAQTESATDAGKDADTDAGKDAAIAKADRLNQQVLDLYAQGDYQEAIPLAQEVLAIREQALGPDHPVVATSLNNLAEMYRGQGQYAKAEPLYKRSLEIYEKVFGASHPAIANTLNNFALQYYTQGEYAQAEQLYQRSLGIYERLLGPIHPSVAQSLNNLGLLYFTKGQYAKAEPLYQRSLSIYEQSPPPDRTQVAITLNNLALLYYTQGDYPKAEPIYQKSLDSFQKLLGSEHPNVAQSLNNLAYLYYAAGDYGKAEPLYHQSLAIYQKVFGPDHPKVAETLNNLALLYHAEGKYAKAEPLYQRSFTIRKMVFGDNHPDVGTSLNNLAELFRAQGQYAKAEPFYIRSINIYEKSLGPEHSLVATALNNLALLYDTQGTYAKALTYYQRSLAIYEKELGPNHPNVALSLNNIAEVYRTVGEYAKAEPFYQRSLAIREKALGPNHPDVGQSFNNLGLSYFLQGQIPQAEAFYLKSLAIWEKSLGVNHPSLARSLNNLALLYEQQNDIQKAIQFTRRGLEIEETNLSQNLVLGSEQDKREYLATFTGTTDTTISLHLQIAPNNLDAAKLALTTILRRKGRVLDVLGQNTQKLRQRLDPSAQQQLDQLVIVRSQLSKLAFEKNLSTDQRQAQLQALSQQSQTLELNLSRKSIAFQQATQPVSLEAVQSAIPAKAALLEFIQYRPFNPQLSLGQQWGAPRYAVYLLGGQGDPKWADLGPVANLQPLIDTFLKSVKDLRQKPEEVKANARKLDAQLMQPIRALFKLQPQQLLIAPDSQLNLIPFAALVDEQNRYLLENYRITYLTSGRDLIRTRDAIVKAQNPLVLANPSFNQAAPKPKAGITLALSRGSEERSGDLARLSFSPLPATAIEADAIIPLLPSARLFTGTQATVTRVKQSPNPRILHLATHGFFLKNNLPDQPQRPGHSQPFTIENPLLRSGLALAGFNGREGGDDDGVLTALEVSGLDLRATQLVVLSACETGLGEVANGEGVYGLRRAFALAGAQSQLMSLWRVSDQGTKDLMIRYYQALAKGQGRGDALRQVQLAMLQQTIQGQDQGGDLELNYQHPYYWSAFIPIGDWSALSP